MHTLRAMLLTLLLIACLPVQAADPAKQADAAASEGLSAVTVFIDVTLGMRKDRAATALTRSHTAFARHCYRVLDVSTYNENGDLQGFFVTYQRADTTASH